MNYWSQPFEPGHIASLLYLISSCALISFSIYSRFYNMSDIRSLLNPDDERLRQGSSSSSESQQLSTLQASESEAIASLLSAGLVSNSSQHDRRSSSMEHDHFSYQQPDSSFYDTSSTSAPHHLVYSGTLCELPSSPTSSGEGFMTHCDQFASQSQSTGPAFRFDAPRDLSCPEPAQLTKFSSPGIPTTFATTQQHVTSTRFARVGSRNAETNLPYLPHSASTYMEHFPQAMPCLHGSTDASTDGTQFQLPMHLEVIEPASTVPHCVGMDGPLAFESTASTTSRHTAAQNHSHDDHLVEAAEGSDVNPEDASSTGLNATRSADLERNRATSSRFRQNVRDEAARMNVELELLRKERRALRSYASQISSHGPLDLYTRSGDITVDFAVANTTDAFMSQSAETAAILGVSKVSDPVAHVMIEIIAARRAMFDKHDRMLTPEETTRLDSMDYDRCFASLRYLDDGVTLAPPELFEARFAEFHHVYHNWDQWENRDGSVPYSPGWSSDDDNDQRRRRRDAPRVASVHGVPPGVKKCRRCHILKTAGSGHRRSHCADGRSVSSDIPFMHGTSVG